MPVKQTTDVAPVSLIATVNTSLRLVVGEAGGMVHRIVIRRHGRYQLTRQVSHNFGEPISKSPH